MALRFTFRQLEYLVAVGEAGSIAAAAARINVSSPSISAAIAQLEAEFGVQIFIRHHARGLALTEGGRRIYSSAQQVLADAAALQDHASDIAEEVRGPLTLGSLITVAPVMSAALRKGFEARFPEARLNLAMGDQATLFQQLRRAEIDLALTYDLDIPGDVAFAGLIDIPPSVMVAAAHPLAARPKVALGDLADLPMVLLDLPISRDYFLSVFQAEGITPRIGERTPDIAMSRSLVAHGFGYGLVNLLPRDHAAPDGAELAYLPLTGRHRPMVLGLATIKSARQSRNVRAFAEYVTDLAEARTLPGIGARGG